MRLEGNVIARSGEIKAKIDFRNKINWRRRYRSPQGVETEREILRIFESDRGRIINSPAIRRLQQKTQVFPLERNAAVRTRLTHSLEVQQVGRYIAKEVLSRLKEQKLLESYGLTEASSLTHVDPLISPRRGGAAGVPLPNTDARVVDPLDGANHSLRPRVRLGFLLDDGRGE